VVRPGAGRDQLGLGRGFKVGTAEGERALEAAVLVEHHTRPDERRPGQVVGEPVDAASVFGEVQHARYPFWRRWRMRIGAKSGSRRAANTAMLWPIAQSASPATHCWRPSPTAAAIVPLTIAMPRGAPPSRIGEPRLAWIGTSNPSMCVPVPITRPALRRRS